MQRPPTVDEARPARCRRCDASAHGAHQRLGLHGHGLRARQLRGPIDVDARATITVLRVRRYRCSACGATTTVVPREFAHPTAVLALRDWSIAHASSDAVRARVSPWRVRGLSARGWRTLRAWVDVLRSDPSFVIPVDWTRRDAHRAAHHRARMMVIPDAPLPASTMAIAERLVSSRRDDHRPAGSRIHQPARLTTVAPHFARAVAPHFAWAV